MNYRYLDLISSAFVAVLLISNIAAIKVGQIGWLVLDGGALIFPLSYIFGDILTEVYGFAVSRRVIWNGLLWLVVFNVVLAATLALPPEPEWEAAVGQASFAKVLGLSPRLALAGWLGFFWGEFCNSYVLARLKLACQGRYVALRTIASTLAGQLVDTGLFCVVAFGGLLSPGKLLNYTLAGYALKVAVEVLMTPVTLRLIRALKSWEGVDAYDRETDFSPFRFATPQSRPPRGNPWPAPGVGAGLGTPEGEADRPRSG